MSPTDVDKMKKSLSDMIGDSGNDPRINVDISPDTAASVGEGTPSAIRPARPAEIGTVRFTPIGGTPTGPGTARITFQPRTRSVEIQNNTGVLLTRQRNGLAGPGSLQIPANSGRVEEIEVEYIGLWIANASFVINDAQQSNNVVIEASV